MTFDERAELLREISVRDGPTVEPNAGDVGAMLLLRDLAERGLIVQTGIEGNQHAVSAGGHSATGDDHLGVAAKVWLSAAESEGWGSHAAEVLRLQRRIAELEHRVSSMRSDLLVLSNAGLDIAYNVGKGEFRWQQAVQNLKYRAESVQERYKLKR